MFVKFCQLRTHFAITYKIIRRSKERVRIMEDNKIRFECDYTEGAHPRIMEALMKTNMEQTIGYGVDAHCEQAREYIKRHCGRSDIDIHFLVGGTQANMTVIASALRPYQGVISAESGHINVHETGAVESTGHKVLALPSSDGKITAMQVFDLYTAHINDDSSEHMVQPAMVYISNPTENGTLYTKDELAALNSVCRRCGLTLFMDGARLGYGLMSEANDLTLGDIAELCDVFYIGGTKVGALFGEAVVIVNKKLKKDFRYYIKQNGAMLAKGRLLGIQFEELFRDNLYFEISKNADRLALMIRKAFEEKGIKMAYDSYTNQQFPILSHEQAVKLACRYSFTMNESELKKAPSMTRFCTSWATTQENVNKLIQDIKAL